MINLKLGTNFDFDLVDKVKDLNDKYIPRGSRIVELYGSERKMAHLTARPDFRLPDISRKHLEQYVKKCNDAEVVFNYTMNGIYPGSKQKLENLKSEIQSFVNYLEDIGCTRITIANPIMLDIVREASKTIELDISTILQIEAVSQIKYLHETYNIKKLCNHLSRNRDFRFLKSAARYCNENGIELELLANEFCGVGGKGYTTTCVYRTSCYLCHQENKTKEDAMLLKGYPMEFCMTSRDSDPYNWLRVRWVRPEDLKVYEKIGVTNFKVTGRTGTTEYLLKMAEAYLNETWNGNLLGLWKPLETIQSEESELEFRHKYFIDNNKLNGFIDHWANDHNFICSDRECGVECKYCEEFYNKMNG